MRISIPVVFVTAAGDLRQNIVESRDQEKRFLTEKGTIFHGVKISEEEN